MKYLEDRIISSQKCEIMITNYQIYSFYEIGDKINAAFINEKEFKVLCFKKFFDIAEKALESV